MTRTTSPIPPPPIAAGPPTPRPRTSVTWPVSSLAPGRKRTAPPLPRSVDRNSGLACARPEKREGSQWLPSCIGVPRFELGTSPTRTERATRLRHTPSFQSVAQAARRHSPVTHAAQTRHATLATLLGKATKEVL